MPRFSDPLSRVRVASPCAADWDTMVGDDQVRFCGQCELNVYNLSALTRTQAENLIGGTERKLCIRFYRRSDGSIITQDCPVGLRALKLRLSRIRKAAAAVLFGFFAGAGGAVTIHGLENAFANSTLNSRGETVMGQIAVRPFHPVTSSPEVGRLEIRNPRRPTSKRRHR